MEDTLGVCLRKHQKRVRRGKTPRVDAVTRKAEGGAAKFQRAATASDRMRMHCSRDRCVGSALEG